MINLFDYATKELSQDAFLCWLFANNDNYKKPQIQKICYDLLNKITNFNLKIGDITELEMWQQWLKIDVVIAFRFDGKRYYVAIEDKVSSEEHSNQLVSYKQSIERQQKAIQNKKYRVEKIFYVYYKTAIIEEEEKNRILKVNWNSAILDISDIYNLFKNVNNSGSEILDNYSEYVIRLYKSWQNRVMPTCEKHDIVSWYCFYKKINEEQLVTNSQMDLWYNTTRYGYAYFVANFKELPKDDIPYLEVRSRDCLNNKFVARLLLYERKNVSKNSTKYLLFKQVLKSEKNSCFNVQKYPEQIGIVKYEVKNENEFIEKLKETINAYSLICNEYKKLLNE